MSSTVLQRNSYGASFNRLTITGDRIHKEAVNPYGHTKLEKELRLLLHIQDQQIPFPIPRILDVSGHSYTMTYLPTYVSLYTVYSTLLPQQRLHLMRKVFGYLETLHSHEQVTVSKEVYARDLRLETRDKILERIEVVKPILEPYSGIRRVNGVTLLSLEGVLTRVQVRIEEHLNTVVNPFYVLIHGDAQFNNILVDPATLEPVFIDPRGYYGRSELYGLCEYDAAKVIFALTGYDVFDNMVVESLDISGCDLTLPNLFLEPEPIREVGLIELLTLTIWLGNAHCFIATPKKAAFSYFYALYLCSRYLGTSGSHG